jgi:hypothetical protein
MSSHLDPIGADPLARSIAEGTDSVAKELEVNVIFNDRQGTLTALKTAKALAHQLRARIILLVAQSVPLSFPLTRPPVSVAFTQQQLLDLVR